MDVVMNRRSDELGRLLSRDLEQPRLERSGQAPDVFHLDDLLERVHAGQFGALDDDAGGRPRGKSSGGLSSRGRWYGLDAATVSSIDCRSLKILSALRVGSFWPP